MPAILRGLIDLGHTLVLEIVAEGIERERQRTHLRDGRVGLAQGYLFAAPPEHTDAELLLLGGAARPPRKPAPRRRPDRRASRHRVDHGLAVALGGVSARVARNDSTCVWRTTVCETSWLVRAGKCRTPAVGSWCVHRWWLWRGSDGDRRAAAPAAAPGDGVAVAGRDPSGARPLAGGEGAGAAAGAAAQGRTGRLRAGAGGCLRRRPAGLGRPAARSARCRG
ncbi:EAL domain-containing protein [Geodermatophilus sp. DF01-2]|nr:EAL domain-containing protein [Geodermatophilus sp. DF01_2]